MPRRNQPRRPGGGRAPEVSPPAVSGWARSETGADGDWLVRTVPGVQATKHYRCPGCDHEIRPGTAHVVAWPAGEHEAASDRRHWHTGCFAARGRRRPTRRR